MKLLEDTVAQIEGMRTWLFSCRYDISNHLAKCLLTREKLRESADPSRAGVLDKMSPGDISAQSKAWNEISPSGTKCRPTMP